MTDLHRARARMVDRHLHKRGIVEPRILDAFRDVPREAFVPEPLAEFAYDDAPLPLESGQTISQPYIVALTAQALFLRGGERLLEVGTGSGYAAAILSRLAREVFTIERVPGLAETATLRLTRLGYTNVHVSCGDGSLGWPEHAPYDAIAVAAGGPRPPRALLEQLTIGGRLVIPVGPDETSQTLLRITRESETSYRQESLGGVRFVPLIGEQAFDPDDALRGELVEARPRPRSSAAAATMATPPQEEEPPRIVQVPHATRGSRGIAGLIREAAEPIDDIDTGSIDALLDRIGDAKLVLLGEATHGTSEFYRMRARITRELIARRGFSFVAAEADWPDAARIDDYVLGGPRRSSLQFTPFARFPTWMWRNQEVLDFVSWQRAWNADHPERKTSFHGLDLYSLFTSIEAVLTYLDEVDPQAAAVARHRYGALTPWQKDPAAYGEAVLVGRYQSSEAQVIATLREMLDRRLDYARHDGERFFDAAQNAHLVANAERYYRAMYYGSVASWNLRDAHMFDTLRALLAFHGPDAKGIVWEHNSHVGDASATEMSTRGEHNVGQLVRGHFGEQGYIVGFGTDHGTVAAAHAWGRPMETMRVVPAREGSYERIFHEASVPAFALHLRRPSRSSLREELTPALLERAIGVIYRPKTELQSHYFEASLPLQFDEYVWFDETRAVQPLEEAREPLDTCPFGP